MSKLDLKKKDVAFGGSVLLLVIALVLAILWYIDTLEYEPLITTVGIAAAILTFFIDPWLENKESREVVFRALAFESFTNYSIMGVRFPGQDQSIGNKPWPCGRLQHASIDHALATGLFNGDKDTPFRSTLTNVRAKIDQYNAFVQMCELQVFLSKPGDFLQISEVIKKSGFPDRMKQLMDEVSKLILTQYKHELGLSQKELDAINKQAMTNIASSLAPNITPTP